MDTKEAAGEAKTDAKPKAKTKLISAGDTVRVVVDGAEPAEATVAAVRKDGTLDLEFEHRGQAVLITSSPYDGEGKRPDSWHHA